MVIALFWFSPESPGEFVSLEWAFPTLGRTPRVPSHGLHGARPKRLVRDVQHPLLPSPQAPLRAGVCRDALPALGLGVFNIEPLSLDRSTLPEKMLLLSREAAEAARK